MVQVAALYNPDMFIWIDETGSDLRNSIRKYGYSLRGLGFEVGGCWLSHAKRTCKVLPLVRMRELHMDSIIRRGCTLHTNDWAVDDDQ